MRKFSPSALAGLALLIGTSVAFAADTYKIDPNHSTVGFKVRHLFGNVTGRFTDIAGAINLDADHPEQSSVSCVIQAKSIDTANSKRDDHLRSPDFFDAAKIPTLAFTSKSVKQLGPDSADVTGDLTMHGVTKEVVLHVKLLGKGNGMNGIAQTGWEATTSLSRKDYGLTWSKAIEGTEVVGDQIDIDLQIEADKT